MIFSLISLTMNIQHYIALATTYSAVTRKYTKKKSFFDDIDELDNDASGFIDGRPTKYSDKLPTFFDDNNKSPII